MTVRYLSTPELPFWITWPLRKERLLVKLEVMRQHALWLCENERIGNDD